MRFIDWRSLGLIFLSYMLWALCYPPFGLGPVAFIVLVPAFMATASLSYKRAFYYHFICAVPHNALMYYWIYNVMKVGPGVVIFMGLLLLIALFALLHAYLGVLFRWCLNRRWGLAWYMFLWVGFEVARTRGQMSFPWNHMGYTQGYSATLIQSVSLFGVFGLSLLIIASNIWVFYCICNRHYKRSILAGLVPLLLGLYGYQSLSEGPHILNPRLADISLVQPSVEQTKKWDDKYFNHVLNLTYDVMNSANLDSGDLIILAETAIPEFIQKRRPAVYTEFHYMARKYHSDIIVGSLDYEPNNHPSKTHNFYNSAFMFPSDTARRVKQYSKLHLVPFSERLPFDNIFPILNYVDLGEGDFSPGEGIMVWGRGFKYSPTICYEVVYPSFIREIRKTGAELIVNITNDGWFGRSTAPYQHLNICRFRAVEAGMPIARCSNSGISAFIDYKGRYLGRTRLMEKTVLRKKIPLITKVTLYQKMGALFEGVLFWFWVIVNALAGISFVMGRYSGKILRRNIRL